MYSVVFSANCCSQGTKSHQQGLSTPWAGLKRRHLHPIIQPARLH
jgi:hypothetical protein